MILMYHGIVREAGDIPGGREPGASLYDVREEDFREQIEYLHKNGYRVVRMDQVARETRPVVLTFDDGEANNCLRAFPILSEHGCPAYFFITVNRVGKKGYMNWEQLRGLLKRGMIIGSHSLNHRILTQIDDDELYMELAESKRILEENLDGQVETLSVPRGFCSAEVLRTAKQVGYRTVFVTDGKDEDGEFTFARTAVKSGWPLTRFTAALNGETPVTEKIFTVCKETVRHMLGEQGYDWVRSRLVK